MFAISDISVAGVKEDAIRVILRPTDIPSLIKREEDEMSFVAETADGGSMGSVSSMSDTAHEGHSSSRTSASSHQDCDLGEGSESESYVEVEHLGEDAMPGTAAFGTTLAGGATSPPPCNVVRHVTKRTLITLHQRSVLEEYYRNGMTSASQQLTEVHEQVTEKTGLDLAVVRVSAQLEIIVCVILDRFLSIGVRSVRNRIAHDAEINDPTQISSDIGISAHCKTYKCMNALHKITNATLLFR